MWEKMRKIRLGAKGGAVAALVLASLLLGGRVGEEIPSPLLAVLPALLLLASDVAGERPVFRRAPLLTGAGLVLIYLVGAWGGGGLWRCLPYAGMAALLVCKAGFFPHGRGKRLACFFWGALLAAAALLTAHPPLRDPEMAGALVGMMEMGILPLLLSFGLAAACRPLLVRRGGLCAALLLLAFVLMTLSMGALWYAGLLNFHRGELQEGFMRHTALLYWDQPLLYFTLLELFAPLSASYLKSARYLRNNRAGRPARE